MIDIHIAKNKKEKDLCYQIREEVFIKGQNVPLERERDGLDEKAEHAILFKDKNAVGCARIRYVNGDMKLERIAVLKKVRGEGLGKSLMSFLIEYSKTKEVKGIKMSAQQYLENFYKDFGFKPYGKPYTDAGMSHIDMYRPKNTIY